MICGDIMTMPGSAEGAGGQLRIDVDDAGRIVGLF